MTQSQSQSPEQTIQIQGLQLQAVSRQRDEANNKLAATEAAQVMLQGQLGFFNAVLGNPPSGVDSWRIGLVDDNAEHFALLCEGFDAVIRGASNG